MRRLVVLRPEPGATATVQAARQMGLDAFAIPLFEVQPLAWDAPEPAAFDALLLTSANAVRCGGQAVERLRGLPVHAVGEATAEAARRAGFAIATVGEAGVERLLGTIDSEQRLLHLCGEHRTEVRARQAIIPIHIYRSTELPPPAGLAQIEGQVIAVHSHRAGRRLAELVDQAGIDRSAIRIAAISESARDSTGAGWDQCEAADAPSEAAMLALAARLCDSRMDR